MISMDRRLSSDTRVYNLDFLKLGDSLRRQVFDEMVIALIRDAIEDYYSYALESNIILGSHWEKGFYFLNGELRSFETSVGERAHFQNLSYVEETLEFMLLDDPYLPTFVNEFYDHLRTLIDQRLYEKVRTTQLNLHVLTITFTYLSPEILIYELEVETTV